MKADQDTILELFEKLIEGRLREAEAVHFERMIREDAEIRKAYLEYAHQHACLYYKTKELNESENRELIESIGDRSRRNTITPWLIGAGACLLFVIAGILWRIM